MTELELALAELAKAEAELAQAEADLKAAEAEAAKPAKPAKSKRAAKPKRTARPIHHPESDLHHEITGYGGPMPSDVRVRIDQTPVVTRELDPMDRPVDHKYAPHECLYEVDMAAGRTDSDSWKRCKCSNCGQYK